MSSTVSSSKVGFSFSDLPVTCKLLLALSFIELLEAAYLTILRIFLV